jgi:ectoine hydroxylase-related dioxygenase (phytanoyl-CoA dioxygenase family)
MLTRLFCRQSQHCSVLSGHEIIRNDMSFGRLVSDVKRRIELASANGRVPVVDLSRRSLDVTDLAAFQRDGVIVIRGALCAAERQGADEASRRLIERAWQNPGERDFVSAVFSGQPEPVPYKIDYLLDKDSAFRILAANPSLLTVVGAIVGPSFIPTWETLVFKDKVAGPRLPWHRDCAAYESPVAVGGSGRQVDAGIYLDPSRPGNCVRCLPGSCYWPADVAAEAVSALNAHWDDYPGVPVLAEAGDVVLHNILTLHSAPEVRGDERRVVYYEYRPAEVEIGLGPHNARYVAQKQRVLRECIAERAASDLGRAERGFRYEPPDELSLGDAAGAAGGFRIAHADYWTWTHVEPEPK